MNLMEKILENIRLSSQFTQIPIEYQVNDILHHFPEPGPGKFNFIYTLPNASNGPVQISITYPNTFPFFDVSLLTNFLNVFKSEEKVEHIIDIFYKLLMGIPVVFYSKNKKNLMAVIESFASFLFPFELQG